MKGMRLTHIRIFRQEEKKSGLYHKELKTNNNTGQFIQEEVICPAVPQLSVNREWEIQELVRSTLVDLNLGCSYCTRREQAETGTSSPTLPLFGFTQNKSLLISEPPLPNKKMKAMKRCLLSSTSRLCYSTAQTKPVIHDPCALNYGHQTCLVFVYYDVFQI